MVEEVITDQYAIYQGDCCSVLPKLPDESVGFSIFSPPFASLYSYSDSMYDMGNAKTYEEFFTHFDFLVKELYRLLMPGRCVSVHCMDLPTHKTNGEEIGLRDFTGDLVRAFTFRKWIYHSRHCIWKDPLIAATRTKAIGLAHKQLVKDSAMSRTGIPDYIVTFRKPGDNPKPIKHPRGLTKYHGERSIPHNLDKFLKWEDTATNKRSHWIWQQYASPVWDDISQTKVLSYKSAREEDDQKHICPLQTQVIYRCLTLWSAPGDVVLTPFMGIGSEVYCAVEMERKGIGVELKPRYFKQAVKNIQSIVSKKERSLR